MSEKKIKITQDFFDDPIRTKPAGTRTFFALFLLVIIALNTCSTERAVNENKEINKQRLEIAKRQYTLDSLQYYTPKSR